MEAVCGCVCVWRSWWGLEQLTLWAAEWNGAGSRWVQIKPCSCISLFTCLSQTAVMDRHKLQPSLIITRAASEYVCVRVCMRERESMCAGEREWERKESWRRQCVCFVYKMVVGVIICLHGCMTEKDRDRVCVGVCACACACLCSSCLSFAHFWLILWSSLLFGWVSLFLSYTSLYSC